MFNHFLCFWPKREETSSPAQVVEQWTGNQKPASLNPVGG